MKTNADLVLGVQIANNQIVKVVELHNRHQVINSNAPQRAKNPKQGVQALADFNRALHKTFGRMCAHRVMVMLKNEETGEILCTNGTLKGDYRKDFVGGLIEIIKQDVEKKKVTTFHIYCDKFDDVHLELGNGIDFTFRVLKSEKQLPIEKSYPIGGEFQM